MRPSLVLKLGLFPALPPNMDATGRSVRTVRVNFSFRSTTFVLTERSTQRLMARRLRQPRIEPGTSTPHEETHDQALARRARRHRRRGDHRQAMLSLREACHTGGQCPRLWTLYAFACVRVRRVDDAKLALRQALWLRQRAKDEPRAQVTQRLLQQLESRTPRFPLRAA